MQETQQCRPDRVIAPWQPLHKSIWLIISRRTLFIWSALLVLITISLTWVGYHLTVDFMDGITATYLVAPESTDTILGWLKAKSMIAGNWLYLIISRILAFYLSFLLAYSLTTPGYAFLSSSAEKIHAGEEFDPDANFNLTGFLIDIFEGIKIALFGVLVTVAAIIVNFIPAIGQVAVFLLYTYYSALMFLDYPASRRRWSLKRKIGWLRYHSSPAFRIGVLPALISMIPIVNIFAIALLFPVLTVHATLNFSSIELARKRNDHNLGEPHGT